MDLLSELKKLRRAIAIELRNIDEYDGSDVRRLTGTRLALAEKALEAISELIDQLRTKQLDHGTLEILSRAVDILDLALRPIRPARSASQTGQIPVQTHVEDAVDGSDGQPDPAA